MKLRLRLYDILRWFGVYKIYEKWLYHQINTHKKEIPKHVGVILDGNRRWAVIRGLDRWKGHEIGAKKLRDLIKWSFELNIKHLTVFVFSTENFKRPKEEVSKLIDILRHELIRAINDEDIIKNGIKVKFIGDLTRFPKDIVELAQELEERTKDNNKIVVNIALGYGGKWDIINATRKIAKDLINGKLSIDDIDYSTYQKYLSTSHLSYQDVDLILRTGGEMRLSNFLLWQAAYSELVFLDIYWPEFRKIDYMRAIRTYQQRSRRFGK